MSFASIRLKRVARVVAGQAPSSDTVSDAGELPFIQGCAEFGSIHPQANKFCDAPPKLAEKGDWLISVRAPVGRLNRADQQYGIGRGLAAVRPKTIQGDFLGYAIAHCTPQLSSVATGSTYEAVSGSDIGNVLVPLPDLSTQKTIAKFLDRETARIDQLIEKKHRLMELLDDHHGTAISALLRGAPSDHLTERSDAPWLGRYPSRWPLLKLSYSLVSSPCYGVLKPDASDGDDAVPLIRIKDVSKDGRVDIDDLVRISAELSAEFSRTILSEGDLVLSVVGTIGRAFVVNEATVGANLSRALARVQTARALDAEFLRLVIGTDWFTQYTNFMTRGTAQKVLNMDTLAAWRFPLPPLAEQLEIVRRAFSLPGNPEHARDLVLQSIDRLKEYRAALITAAVTGQIDVATWSRRGDGDRRLDKIEEEMAG